MISKTPSRLSRHIYVFLAAFAGASAFGPGCSDNDPENNNGSTCGPDQILCGDTCTSTQVDAANCGACSVACAAGEVCSQGMCSTSCGGGTTQCGSSCVDVSNDPVHCGDCDKPCAAGELCSQGMCSVVCLGGTKACGTKCVDVLVDSANCGECDQACPTGEVCLGGACSLVCAGGTTRCDNKCVDTMVDANNCGVCGNQCAMSENCSAGACSLVCSVDTIACNNACVNVSSDEANCGACDNLCLFGTRCGSGVCTAVRTGYLKASNTDAGDGFGRAIAYSVDRSTLAVAARGEASAAMGINGNQADDSAAGAGAVYVYDWFGGTGVLQAYVKASNTASQDQFGDSVTLSADGNTLVVGATGEDSNATGVNGNQMNELASSSGAAYVFVRNGTVWTQQAYLKASNAQTNDLFGYVVALSADGNTLAVSAASEDGGAPGVNADQMNNLASSAGAAYVFTRTGTTWVQQAYIKASNPDAGDDFGNAMALSGDGNTLAVAAPLENGNATGINGNDADNSAGESGAVYIYTRTGGIWSQQAYIKASNTNMGDMFGFRVSLSHDGSRLAVGAISEDSAATGINGNQNDESAAGAGAVYLFVRNGTTWSQEAYVKASNTGAGDLFGVSVSMSADGTILAVGASNESSSAMGLDGDQTNDLASNSGAVYLFARVGTTWTQRSYIKALNTDATDHFGSCVALAADGKGLIVGAPDEDSIATGPNGNPLDDSAANAGATYSLF
jgi:FG-GAP repeat/Stigma-specific protein, Stig1